MSRPNAALLALSFLVVWFAVSVDLGAPILIRLLADPQISTMDYADALVVYFLFSFASAKAYVYFVVGIVSPEKGK